MRLTCLSRTGLAAGKTLSAAALLLHTLETGDLPIPGSVWHSSQSPRLDYPNSQVAHIGDSTTKPPDFRCLSAAFCGSSLSPCHSRYQISQRERHLHKHLGRSQHNAENLLMPVQRTLRVKPANGKRVVLGDLGNKSTISQAASEVPTSNVCKEKPKPSLAKVKKKCNQPQNTEVQENVIVKQVKEKPLQASTQLYALAKYLSELSLIDYDMVHYPASQVSAAAFALALKVLDFGEWTSTLQHYTGYTEDHLMSAMKHLANNVLRVNEGMTKHTIIKTKYASPGHMKISTIPHLKSDSVRTLSESLS
ncbi:CCNB1 protein, partial [Polypterus senegalus]